MSLYAQMEKNAQFQAELQRYEEQADFLFRKQRFERIESFTEQDEFLSTEFPCSVYYQGIIYNSVHAAYQAARTEEKEMRERIAQAQSIQEIYQIGQQIDDPNNWSKQRLKIMEILLRDKFRRNSEIRDKLRLTQNFQLINTYTVPTESNLYWGVVDGKGQNQLGRLLEQIRSDLNNQEDIDKWLLMVFPIEQETYLLPTILLKVNKENESIDPIELKGKRYYYFGQNNQRNHVILAHPTISRRHAAIYISDRSQVCLVDLGSKGGTFLNETFIEPHIPQILSNHDIITFARSSRRYVISIDFYICKKALLKKINNLETSVRQLERISKGQATIDEMKASFISTIKDTVMVKNLPDKANQIELFNLFSKFGKIKEVKIPLDRQTGNTKNVAFIRFEDEKIAKSVEKVKYNKDKLKLQCVDYGFVERFQEDLRWGQETQAKQQETQQQQQQVRQDPPTKPKPTKKVQVSSSSSSSSSSSDSDSSSSSSRSRSRNRHKKKHNHHKKYKR